MKPFRLPALLPVLFSLSTLCQAPSPQYFNELTIDSGLHIVPAGAINQPDFKEPDQGSYYAPFYGASGLSVDHFEKKPGAVTRERSLYLEAGRDQVLDRTVKTDEILRGPFGSVNAEKVCFYTRPIRNGTGSVSVEFNNNGTEHELPSEISEPPINLPALTSFSLIRIFRAYSKYMIISANYEQDGNLGSVNFGSTIDANAVGSETAMYRTGDPQVDALVQREQGELATALKKYGIPTHIDIGRYLLSHQIQLPAVALQEEKNVMNEFYGFGAFIRQNNLKDGASMTSRWLQPSLTKEEKETLNPLCEARFRQQQAMGLPTVE